MDLFDCVISCGERDLKHYGKYLDNEHRRFEIAKHNVTEAEAKEWLNSDERMKRTQELEDYGKKIFKQDYWEKFSVSYYYTRAKSNSFISI